MLCLSILRDLLFHVDSIGTPNEVSLKIDSLFWNTKDIEGHPLENELISLSPTHFETIQDFFTKFKLLVLQPKQCGIYKKEYNIIFYILSHLGP